MSKEFQKELLNTRLWNSFLNSTVEELYKLYPHLETQIYEATLIKYELLIIGFFKITDEVFFNYCCLEKIKPIIESDLKYFEFNSKDIEIIYDLVKDQMKKYYLIHKNTIISDSKIMISKYYSSKETKIVITIDDHKHKYILFNKEYLKLKSLCTSVMYDYWIVILLERYKFYGRLKSGISLSVNNIYEIIKDKKLEDISLECFSGSLNSNLKNYCSLFPDIEDKFQSKGSFFNIESPLKYQILILNPPFMIEIMEAMSIKLLELLDENKFSSIVIIPDWRSKFELTEDSRFININPINTVDRSTNPYPPYDPLLKSKYLKKVYVLGNYMFYSYWENKSRKMSYKYNVLIMILSSKDDFFDIKEIIQ